MWSVCFFSECEADLASRGRERKPRHTLRPLPVKHLRWQFEFPGGSKLPGLRERGRRGGRAGLAWPGLQVLTQAGIVPSGDGSGWGWEWVGAGGGENCRTCAYCKHIHRRTVRLCLLMLGLRQPPNLFFTPRLPVWARRSHSSRPGRPAFLRPV